MPTSATIGPMMAASEYAGEVEASPMTIELTKPIAPGLRVCFRLCPIRLRRHGASWPGPDGPWGCGRIGASCAPPTAIGSLPG